MHLSFLRLSVSWLFSLSLALALSSCKSTENIDAQAPAVEPVKTKQFERKLSAISIPVSFPIRGLEERINQEVQGVLYKDENLADDNVAITVTKLRDIGVKAENDQIYFSIPLNIYVKGRWAWKACNICPELSKTEDTRFDLVLRTASRLSLTEDYKIKTSTVSDFDWGDTKPTISLGPLSIGLARFVEPVMKKQMQTLSAQLDQELTSRIKIKDYIRDAWVQLQQPIELNRAYNAWLVITPQEIRVTPLQARANELSMRIGIRSYIETVTQASRPAPAINRNLPPLITDQTLPSDVAIGLIGEIPYEQATQMLKREFAGKSFSFEGGKQQVTVNDASLGASGEKLVLMLDIDGKARSGIFTKKIIGKVFLKAIPYFDASTSTIRVRDVEYDLQSKDALLKTASWLVKNRFRENLEKQLAFPVKAQLDEARKSLQHELDKSGKINDYVSLKGTITDIVPDDIYLTPTSIKAVVNAKGNLQVRLEKL